MPAEIMSVSGIALSKAEKMVLKVTVSLLCKQDVYFEYSSVFSMDGVAVINVDDPHGHAFYTALQTNQRAQHVILLSKQRINTIDKTIALQRPLRVYPLKEALANLYDKTASVPTTLITSSSTTQEKKVIEVETIQKTDNQQPTSNLLLTLLDIKQQQLIVKVQCSLFPPLYINAQEKTVLTTMSKDDLYEMVRNPFLSSEVTSLEHADFEALNNQAHNHQLPFNVILWSVALYGSNGQLIQALESKALRLKAWPNFSRLKFDSQHMLLASILSKRTMNLAELEEITNYTRNILVGFCNAAYVCDLLEIKDKNDSPNKLFHHSTEKPSIIKRIAARLGLSFASYYTKKTT